MHTMERKNIPIIQANLELVVLPHHHYIWVVSNPFFISLSPVSTSELIVPLPNKSSSSLQGKYEHFYLK